jgi:hypothetical protein
MSTSLFLILLSESLKLWSIIRWRRYKTSA